MRTPFAIGLLVLCAASAAAAAAEGAPGASVDRTSCQPQPDCRVNYPDLPPGRSSEMRKGMTPSGQGSSGAASSAR